MKRNTRIILLVPLVILFVIPDNKDPGDEFVPLEGAWRFAIDTSATGESEKWFGRVLPETIRLPGSMLTNGKGFVPDLETKWTGSIYDSSWFRHPRMAKYRRPGNMKFPFWLTPDHYYVGQAWYQKDIFIPAAWKRKRIILYLERPHWETTVWLDTTRIGMQNSLSTPHEYELPDKLSPGRHTITVRVDNRIRDINVGPDSHSLTDHTQGNWNGLAGKIGLKTGSKIFIDDVKVFPDVQVKTVKVLVSLKNETGKPVKGCLSLSAVSFNSDNKHTVEPLQQMVTMDRHEKLVEIILPMGTDMQLWDEFNPALYMLKTEWNSGRGFSDVRYVQFGMREFKTRDTRFQINGRNVFLRGTVECAAFPRTGYPPCDKESWAGIFKICRLYGLNHMRFHSWCPPEAAFTAADEAGIYLQVEGPFWTNHGTAVGAGKPVDKYIYDESERIVDAYGNHPSFCMMAYGNEPAGRNQVQFLGEFVSYWKTKDNRRIYTHASVGKRWPHVPGNEFIVRAGARGLPWDERPQSLFDYSGVIDRYSSPYVAHEMGQHCAFPDFREIEKYNGPYHARNFELFREDLTDHQMGGQAEDFLMASGKLQVLCYKSEIEASLRTPGNGGFQLLSLNDFPGQGTALVGVLDVFWDEKDYVHADEFRRFCDAIVPLARIPRFVYMNFEIFRAAVEVAHFGDQKLEHVTPRWKVTRSDGSVISEGSLAAGDINPGSLVPVGEVVVSLSGLIRAEKINLEIMVGDRANDWDIWVYPAILPVPDTSDIYIARQADDATGEILQKGGMVFLHGAGKVEYGRKVVQYFRPVFWNTSWFKMRPPHTTGILCDPDHPAFTDFPTDYHSDLQWWEILHKQQVMIMDSFPAGFKPIVQPIDTWFLNRRLGLIFEARVGKGKIIVCSADLLSGISNRPAARQLYYSLINYMNSEKFMPEHEVDYAVIRDIFTDKSWPDWNSYAKDSPDDLIPEKK
ncbi:MAG: beta-glucuronidase [Bacteroidales bacterium]|nr:beta-glucuronidase [Bacteroidales bacterium]